MSLLPTQNKLAGTPKNLPQYNLQLKMKNGENLIIADPKVTRALVALMDMGAVIGGAASHYGGPAAFADLMSVAHAFMFKKSSEQKKEWYESFNFVNDAGHCENGLYALKANYKMAGLSLESLKKFRSITSPLTGHGESHLFPEGVLLSNGPLGSAFPQSQGLAMADAHAKNSRVTITAISDGACMEGEAKEAFAAIPGLAARGQVAPYILIISDNNTKLSGRIDKESFSMAPTFNSLQDLGWKVISLEDGHDLNKCLAAVEEAYELATQNPKQPVAIHAKTIKGIGTKKTAESSSGGHGFPLKSATELKEFITEIYDGTSVPAEFMSWTEELIALENKMKASQVKPTQPEEKIQTGVAAAMIKARKNGFPVVSITSDLPGSTGVAGFRKEFPQDSFDIGVAEANMVSSAVGFAKVGYIPVVDTFAQFGVTKGALPHTMASLSDGPMIAIYSHTGFQDAADGASHQALCYLAMSGAIPHVETYCLTCSEEAEALVYQAIEKMAEARKQNKTPKSYLFFLGRENFPKKYIDGARYKLGQAQIVSENNLTASKKIALVAGGSLLPEAIKAAGILAGKGIGSVVVNPAVMNLPDVATLKSVLQKTGGNMVTVEDHQLIGGMGAVIAHALANQQIPFKMRSLGVHGEFGQSAYTAQDLYKKHGLDADAIVKAVLES